MIETKEAKVARQLSHLRTNCFLHIIS